MTPMTRRRMLSLMSGLAALGLAPASAEDGSPPALGDPAPFDAETVVAKARALAAAPHVPPPAVSPEWLNLDFDAFRGIWFDTRNALFRDQGSAVRADFFVAGLYSRQRIAINAVEGGEARPVLFDIEAFDRTDRFPALPPEGTGFSGFRLRGELETEGVFQEYAVFQGASYFRAIGRGHNYGISARGLALDTGEPGGEEFPVFREFWIEAAPPGARTVRVHALLDSPSVAGAFRFDITKGDTTEMLVSARLFPRVDLATVGIAPGTSMFLFSDINRPVFDDFREAVHDSDGLLMMNGASETLWRPLNNPTSLQISSFADSGPRGFGLMQRARDLRDYNDLEARYETRPSLWVEPEGDWGPGAVVLVEIPTDQEINDNIVAFWRPAEPLEAGGEYPLDYRLYWCSTAPAEGAVARIIATRTGARVFEEGRLFAIDYAPHPALGDDPSRVEVRVSTSAGEISSAILHRNPATGGMRLDLTLTGDVPVAELRAELWRGGQRAAEVWLTRWLDA
ncbi:glucan biosynthesis protein [Histidinibacterium lentulum]|uniref:Glucans biosynthesis protein n=1 Tax=Histidinibacterium lentulum TaxID=2480588 RepID=A0A3N2R6T0_9RHOB|nr:glucan biosynthesis protein [Histidinibacterium lentulum]ROU03202.1 glucans biosynthesis protein [Histidinibacterium lentulum]